MLTLDVRLQAVAESIIKYNVLADIGSDHGYLPIFLLKHDQINQAIVTDINSMPLENSKKNAEKYNVDERCDFRLGGGLSVLEENECDVISICGMGGDTIASILSNDLQIAYSAQKLILQPMTNQIVLRKYLVRNHFQITSEKIVKDKHLYYQIITAQKGDENNLYKEEIDFEFPKSLLYNKDRIMHQYILYKMKTEERILARLLKKGKSDLIQTCNDRLKNIKELIKYYES